MPQRHTRIHFLVADLMVAIMEMVPLQRKDRTGRKFRLGLSAGISTMCVLILNACVVLLNLGYTRNVCINDCDMVFVLPIDLLFVQVNICE